LKNIGKLAKSIENGDDLMEKKMPAWETSEDLYDSVKEKLTQIATHALYVTASEVDFDEPLSEYGLDSMSATEFIIQVNDYYKLNITPATMFEHTTLNSFVAYLIEQYADQIRPFHNQSHQHMVSEEPSRIIDTPAITSEMNQLKNEALSKTMDIAVIGMHGKFPKSPDLATFWQHLKNQDELISEVPISRWNWQDIYGDTPDKTKVKYGGFVDDIYHFDAEFFSIPSYDAELIDPQQRLLLESVWNSMEDAGYLPQELSSIKTGLFVGISTHDYAELLERNNIVTAALPLGNAHCMTANRISYFLNIKGPSLAIDTACSSALVALHEAVTSLQQKECELAIVGGVNALLSPSLFIAFSNAGMLSSDGHCKTFDQSANGYVRGEGVGSIFLKPLDKALTDHDKIYAVIKGSAINHGGHANGLTVPNPVSQAEVIEKATTQANIPANSLSFIEMHGTGTALGDPVEINGIKIAMQSLKEKQGLKKFEPEQCGLGSVKNNIGHLEAGAGIASVIKVLLSMQHETLPGMAYFNKLNPQINTENTPLYIVEKTKSWDRLIGDNGREIPRRAGISSFGFGGTNAHVVLEEFPRDKREKIEKKSDKPYYLLTLSAKSQESLQQMVNQLQNWLIDNKETNLESISYTLNVKRLHFKFRTAIVASTLNEFIKKLKHAQIREIVKNPADQATHEKILSITLHNLEINLSSKEKYKENLETLSNLYLTGYEIDWTMLHKNEMNEKIHLPGYVFHKVIHSYPMKHSLPTKKERLLDTSSPPIVKDIYQTVIDILTPFSKVEKISDELKIASHLGLSSLDWVSLKNKLYKSTYTSDIDDVLYFHDSTVKELVNAIKNNQEATNEHTSQNKIEHPFSELLKKKEIISTINKWSIDQDGVQEKRIDRQLVHKKHDKNVFIARMTQLKDSTIIAEMVRDNKHEYFYEHEQDHITGMYLVEAARQFTEAVIHRYINISNKISFVLKSFNVNFHSFVEHDRPVFLITLPNISMQHEGTGKMQLLIVQNGEIAAEMEYSGSVLMQDTYARYRRGEVNK
jgi:acyl transferase domain-containing protein